MLPLAIALLGKLFTLRDVVAEEMIAGTETCPVTRIRANMHIQNNYECKKFLECLKKKKLIHSDQVLDAHYLHLNWLDKS